MAQQVIQFTRKAASVRARRARDQRVRAAQRRAFDEVLRSPDGAARRKAVRVALDAFLDACETAELVTA